MVGDDLLTDPNVLSAAQVVAAFVTAGATIALVAITCVLARATRKLSEETSKPFVIASIEPNQWSLLHLDLIIENSGNAAAFDISIESDPPMEVDKLKRSAGLPFQSISLLRPGQRMKSYVAEYKAVSENKYTFSIRWKRHPKSKRSEEIHYTFDVSSLKGKIRLGAESPEHQIADQIKRIREDWKSVAIGQRKLKVDTYSHRDRDRAAEELRQLANDLDAESDREKTQDSQD